MHSQWQGPFPPPEALERYEKLEPGTWNRMLSMAEQAQAAQIETEKRAHELARSTAQSGFILGWITTLVAMGLAAWCVMMDSSVVAGLFLSVPVMSVAKALIEAHKSKAKKP